MVMLGNTLTSWEVLAIPDFAGIGAIYPCDQVEKSRFSGPIESYGHYDLSFIDVNRDI
jgi:hypothetical protein